MDIQKEREVFENHLKKMGKTDNETFSKNEDDSYQMDIIHFGWKIWQAKAQAVPEGFALVPKEPTKEALIEIASVCIGDDFANLDEAKELYKAMIEAQEPNQPTQFNLDEFLAMEEKLKHKGGVITADLDRFITYAEMVLSQAKALKESK